MPERFHSHVEQVERKNAAELGRAAHELGKFSVMAIANEGESFYGDSGNQTRVEEGQIALRISGMGDTGPLYGRAAEIHKEMQAQHPNADQAPHQNAT